jgi:hypothetical protein
MRWFNLQDVHRDKGMSDKFSSYRGRIARTHAKFARHIDVHKPTSGRPQRITLLTQEGVELLYEHHEALPHLVPYPTPMRLTDKARNHIVDVGLFTTGGLEQPPRTLERAEFIAFLVKIGNEDLIEPDFVDL